MDKGTELTTYLSPLLLFGHERRCTEYISSSHSVYIGNLCWLLGKHPRRRRLCSRSQPLYSLNYRPSSLFKNENEMNKNKFWESVKNWVKFFYFDSIFSLRSNVMQWSASISWARPSPTMESDRIRTANVSRTIWLSCLPIFSMLS